MENKQKTLDRTERIRKINYLITETDALYHQAAQKLGLSDSVMLVLYHLYDNGGSCLLSEICRQSGISKQTINSAIRRLEQDKIICLKQHNKKSKQVLLTESGKVYAKETIARLFQAEASAYLTWSEEELSLYIRLMEKYAAAFRKQLETL